MAWVRARRMAPKFDPATSAAQPIGSKGGSAPHSRLTINSAATTLAAAKIGASWAREMSWASRSGEPLSSPAWLVKASDSPPGSRAEIMRL